MIQLPIMSAIIEQMIEQIELAKAGLQKDEKGPFGSALSTVYYIGRWLALVRSGMAPSDAIEECKTELWGKYPSELALWTKIYGEDRWWLEPRSCHWRVVGDRRGVLRITRERPFRAKLRSGVVSRESEWVYWKSSGPSEEFMEWLNRTPLLAPPSGNEKWTEEELLALYEESFQSKQEMEDVDRESVWSVRRVKFSISGYVSALVKQHQFDLGVAYACAHLWVNPDEMLIEVPTDDQIRYYMRRVRHVPDVSAELAQQMLERYFEKVTAHSGTQQDKDED